jgi:hypothetical protein
MLRTPVEICIGNNNNNKKLFLLEPGTYYVGRADAEFAREIRDRFGDPNTYPEYKYAIYLFKKSGWGLELIDIISEGVYDYVSRYQFRLDVNPNGNDYGNVILSISDYGRTPKRDALYSNGDGIFRKKELKFNEYLELLITGENDIARFKFGLVGVIDIIGPSGYTKKDGMLEYTIRIYTKKIITERHLQKMIDLIDNLIIKVVDDKGGEHYVKNGDEVLFELDHDESLFETTIEVDIGRIEVKEGRKFEYFQLELMGMCNNRMINLGKSEKIYFENREDRIKKDNKIYSINLNEFMGFIHSLNKNRW